MDRRHDKLIAALLSVLVLLSSITLHRQFKVSVDHAAENARHEAAIAAENARHEEAVRTYLLGFQAVQWVESIWWDGDQTQQVHTDRELGQDRAEWIEQHLRAIEARKAR